MPQNQTEPGLEAEAVASAFAARAAEGLQTIAAPGFDLASTLLSGQAFHWQKVAGGYAGLIGKTPVFLREQGPGMIGLTPGTKETARHYLALDHDMEAIVASFPADDAVLAQAVAFAPGLRLLRQPAWECLATFITSSMKQVAHIAHISHTLRRRFGEPVAFHGAVLHAYPEPEALARAGEAALRACGLGYRAPFLEQTARLVAEGKLDLSLLADPGISDEEALALLLQAPGVGPKIANCVLLFAGQRLGFFPIDVWIERVLRAAYFPRRKKLPAGFLPRFVRQHFGPYGGYAQQFLFHHARLGGKGGA